MKKATALSGVAISVIVTSHNEGKELVRTLRSIQKNTISLSEIIVVDDASTDSSCSIQKLRNLSVIKHTERLGIAYSRDEASRKAIGNVFAYLDAHQRLDPGCLDKCAELSLKRQSIVCPDVRGFEPGSWTLHGAVFTKRKDKPPFGAEWRVEKPKQAFSTVNALRAPAYVIPAEVYPKVRWSRQYRGWGGSEGAVSLKAFFSGVKILHLHGPIAYHRFKKKFHYDVGWNEVWRNHAITARICFAEETWHKYWWPKVFAPHIDHKTSTKLESSIMQREHLKFQAIKVRSDHEFWTRLIRRRIPKSLESKFDN